MKVVDTTCLLVLASTEFGIPNLLFRGLCAPKTPPVFMRKWREDIVHLNEDKLWNVNDKFACKDEYRKEFIGNIICDMQLRKNPPILWIYQNDFLRTAQFNCAVIFYIVEHIRNMAVNKFKITKYEFLLTIFYKNVKIDM